MTWRPAGPLCCGSRMVAPADVHEEQRDEPADHADRAGDDGADGVQEAAGQLPPDGGGDDDGQADEEQPGPVAPVLGLELPGGAPDRADGRTERVGDAEPDRGDTPPEGESERGNGASAVADGSRCRALRLRSRPTFGAGLPRDWLPDDRVEDPDAFEPARAAGLEVSLFRDAGGEDVRVAMLGNLHRCHSSPRPHTPGRGTPTWAVHGTRPIAGSLSP